MLRFAQHDDVATSRNLSRTHDGGLLTRASRPLIIHVMLPHPVVAEIRRDAIIRNVQAIRSQFPANVPVCAAIKADAYGHGIPQVLPALREAGVERAAVATLDEALQLRRLGWHRPILIMGPALCYTTERELTRQAAEAVATGVAATVASDVEAGIFARAAERLHRRARVEIQIDTGMGRSGLLLDRAEERVAAIAANPRLVVEGVYTHFSTADEPDLTFAREQLNLFSTLVERLKARALPVRGYHAANSAAIFRLPGSHFDRVRPGLAVYGYWGGPEHERPDSLIPSMRVTSRLACIRKMPEAHPIGYGRTFITRRPSIIGLVPLGYGDGYRRLLSSSAWMTLPPSRGRDRTSVPVVGRVSMDLVTVDLTDAGDVREGDPIIIIDDQPDAPNSVERLAHRLDTIPYEVTCLLGQRIRRVSVEP